MKRSALFLPLVLAFALSACTPTQTQRSTGQALDDVAMTARVKTQIGQSLGIKEAATINVDTFRGAVSLAGFVNSEQQVREAEKAAKQVPGVEKVFNHLHVKKAQ